MSDWFRGAGLGLFIHWDHASQQGLEISWPLAGGVFSLPESWAVGVDEYHASAATFDPVAWDARALARRARACGMRYAVLTTKHHSGYAMFACPHSDFGVMQSPCGRDLVAEYVDAVRAAAANAVEQGFLLPSDAETHIANAEASNVLVP